MKPRARIWKGVSQVNAHIQMGKDRDTPVIATLTVSYEHRDADKLIGRLAKALCVELDKEPSK